MNPVLFLINYTKNKQEFYKKILFNNNITQMTFIPSVGKSGSKLLNLLGLGDLEKEVLFTICDFDKLKSISQLLNTEEVKKDKMMFAITLPILRAIGMSEFKNYHQDMEDDKMRKAMFIIVDRGQADRVINLTNSLGATGATIINARGSGIFLEKKFNMEIEPEKEIVFIITSSKMEETIAKEIAEKLQLAEPNKGILFSLPVVETFGIK